MADDAMAWDLDAKSWPDEHALDDIELPTANFDGESPGGFTDIGSESDEDEMLLSSMPEVGEAEPTLEPGVRLIGDTIFVRHEARDSVAIQIWQLDQKARAIFQLPAWEGLGGNKPTKWASLHKTHFRDKIFLQTGKGSRKTKLGPGWTELKFKNHETEEEVKTRAEEVLARLEDGRTEGKPFMRPPKKAEPSPRAPPVPGKDVSALLYLIATDPARVQTALAKSEAIDDAAAAGAVAMAVERTGAQNAKRGRLDDKFQPPQRLVSGESIQGKSGDINDGFLTFKKDGNEAGRIKDGEGGKGITLVSSTGDFAEWHPVAHGEAQFQEGDLIGLRCQPGDSEANQKLYISRQTDGAEMLGVISRQAIVEGNAPPEAEKDMFDKVAYVGRVPVRLQTEEAGKSKPGDLVFPSGANDGTGTTFKDSVGRSVGAIVSKLDSRSDDPMVEIAVSNPPDSSLSKQTMMQEMISMKVDAALELAEPSSLGQLTQQADVIAPTNCFAVRARLEKVVCDWAHERSGDESRHCVVFGEPGSGKTTLLKQLAGVESARLAPALLAVHFCVAHDPDTLKPATFVRSLVKQLLQCRQLPEYKQLIEQDAALKSSVRVVLNGRALGGKEQQHSDPLSSLLRCVLEPLAKLQTTATAALPCPTRCLLYIVVDSLDEALLLAPAGTTASHETVLGLLQICCARKLLPPWLKLLVTSRDVPEARQLTNMPGWRQPIELEDSLLVAESEQAIQHHVRLRLEQPGSDLLAAVEQEAAARSGSLGEPAPEESMQQSELAYPRCGHWAHSCLQTLVERSAGNFLYAVTALNDIEAGHGKLAHVESLPPGLHGLLYHFFERKFPRPEDYEAVRPVLEAVMASDGGLSEPLLLECLRVSDPTAHESDYARRLQTVRQYLLKKDVPVHATTLEPILIDPAASDEEEDTVLFDWIDRDGDGALSRADMTPLFALCNIDMTDGIWTLVCSAAGADPAVGITRAQNKVLSQRLRRRYPPHSDKIIYNLIQVVNQLTAAARPQGRFVLYHQSLASWLGGSDSRRFHVKPASGSCTIAVSLLAALAPDISEDGAEHIAAGAVEELGSVRELRPRHIRLVGSKLAHMELLPPWPIYALVRQLGMLVDGAGASPKALGKLLRTTGVSVEKLCRRGPLRFQGSYPVHAAAFDGCVSTLRVIMAAQADVEHPKHHHRLWECSAFKHISWSCDVCGKMGLTSQKRFRCPRGCDWYCCEACLLSSESTGDGGGGGGGVATVADLAAKDGLTPLHFAAMQGHAEVAQWLVAEGKADVEAADENGLTPLHFAAAQGRTKVLRWLVTEGKADVEAAVNMWATTTKTLQGSVSMVMQGHATGTWTKDGMTPLHMAALHGHAETVQWLVTEGKADAEAVAKDGYTPLHSVAEEGHVEVVQWLVAEGKADVGAAIKDGYTPLHSAAACGHSAVVQWLVTDDKADVEAAAEDGRTPLHFAAHRGHLDVVQWLVTEGKADVDAAIRDGYTPLHAAAMSGHAAVVHYLVAEGKVDVNVATKNGGAPLFLAAAQGHLEVVQWLVTEGKADVSAVIWDGRTPLHSAALQGHMEIVQWLVMGGKADVNAANKIGSPPLHSAASQGHLEVVQWLVTEGSADVEAADENGKTPLHSAASGGHVEVVQWLVVEGKANVKAADEIGLTPLDYAKAATLRGHRHVELAQWLAAAGTGSLALLHTTGSMIRHDSIVGALLDMGFSLNASKRAAIAVDNNSASSAVEWCFSHNKDPDFNDPIAVMAAAAPSGSAALPMPPVEVVRSTSPADFGLNHIELVTRSFVSSQFQECLLLLESGGGNTEAKEFLKPIQFEPARGPPVAVES
jgi:cytohesin